MLQNKFKQCGFSLIEMMVAISIATSALYFGWTKYSKQEQIRVNASAKLQNNNSLEQLMEWIKRDQHHTVADSDMQLLSQGLGLQLRPIRPGQDDPNVSYQVRFASGCKSISGQYPSYREVYDDPYLSTIYQAGNSCLAKLNCRKGQYPSVDIITTGTGAPPYSPSSLPMLGKSVLDAPVGIALCAEQRAGHAFIWTESIMVEGGPGAYKIKVVTRPLLLPKKVVSDLVFLPN